jgi:hypothetical protein
MKTIKYNLLIPALMALVLYSCQHEEFALTGDLYNENSASISIALDDKYKEFNADEHFISATFQGNFWWNAEIKLISQAGDYETENWFSMTPTRNFGSREINIFLAQNIEKHHDRSIEISFSSDDKSYTNTLVITQKACNPFIDLSANEKSFSILGGEIDLLVNTSEQWKFSNLPDWIKATYDQTKAFVKGKKIPVTFEIEAYQGSDVEEDRVFEIVFESTEDGSPAQSEKLTIKQARMAKAPDGITITNDEDLLVTWNSVAGSLYYDVLAYDLSGNLVGNKRYEPTDPEKTTQSCSVSDINWSTYVGKIDVTVKAYLSEEVSRESSKGTALSHNYFSDDSGNGTNAGNNILKIYTLRHLENVHKSMAAGKYLNFKLMNNLDLSYYTNNTYSPIGSETTPFIGSFDGNGQTIKSLTYQNTKKIAYNNDPFYFGIFGVVSSDEENETVIFNLKIEDFNILANDASTAVLNVNKNYAAAAYLAGRVNNGAIIRDCVAKNSILSGGGATTRNYLGGFVGLSDYAVIRNCQMQGGSIQMLQSGQSGGFIGQSINALTTIENCVNNIDFFNTTTSVTFGGIMGRGVGTVKNCVNYANMRLTMYTGGIIGHASYYLDGTSLKAGIVTIEDCVNYGSYEESANIGPINNSNGASASGGIIGQTGVANNSISRCANYGKLVNHIYNRTNADNQSIYFGGIIGNATNTTISDCANYGDFRGTAINNTSSNTRVYNAGGIAGRMNNNSRSIMLNCLNTGSVVYTSTGTNVASTTMNIGALCGLFDGTPTETNISMSFALSGLVDSTSKLLGSKDLNEGNSSAFKTESELKTGSTFTGWDTSIWLITDGNYPELKGIVGKLNTAVKQSNRNRY